MHVVTDRLLESGESWRFKVGDEDTAPAVEIGQQVDDTWSEWDGVSDIKGMLNDYGKLATFVIINSAGNVVASGTTIVKCGREPTLMPIP